MTDEPTLTQCERIVIFLDIDGVLLPVPRFTFGGGELSAECVQRLASLVASMGGPDKVTLVLSSTWRTQPAMVARLNAFFRSAVADALPVVSDGTPNGTVIVSEVSYYPDDPTERRLVRDRVDEIYHWLHIHLHDHPEANAGRWLAIDDMQLDVDERMRGHFLHTETETGITDDDCSRGVVLAKALVSPTEAHAKALAALRDPALKDEEIAILRVQRDRLEDTVTALRAELAAATTRLAQLGSVNAQHEKELKQQAQRIEEMSFRLAVTDFAKRYDVLREAVQAATQRTGPAKKDLDERIKRVVNLLREKKELEKRVRAAHRKSTKAPTT